MSSSPAGPPLDRFAAWWRAPERAGILLDFDGTLAPIVADPRLARPLPGAGEVLTALAARYRTVAVVSGRPVAFLAEHLGGSGARLSGLYGLESWEGGRPVADPEAERWRSEVAAAADAAAAELPARVGVERKGLSVTLHVRVAPELDGQVRDWAARRADRSGLALHPAKRSYELRPPVAADKGTVVAELSSGLSAVCFVGDDVGDLPAFAALGRLGPEVDTVRVVVGGDETPEELLAEADVVVAGPSGAMGLLGALAGDAPSFDASSGHVPPAGAG